MRCVVHKIFVAAVVLATLVSPSMSLANSCESTDCNECYGVLTVSGDLLVLQACLDAAWATRIEGAVTHGVYVDYGRELGLRIDAQYMDSCNKRDISGGYTFFDQNMTGSYEVPATGVFFELTGGTDPALAGTTAIVEHAIKYGELDVVLGHSCCTSDGLAIRVFGGFKGLFVEQTVNTSAEIFGPTTQTVSALADYDAFGLVGGFTPIVKLGKSCCNEECWGYELSIIGETAASVVVGELFWTCTTEGAFKGIGTNIESDRLDCHCTLGAHLAMGFIADACYCSTRIGLSAGYEFKQWKDVGSVYGQKNSAYLGLHGVFIRGILSI
jgi:hypothetical protein